MFQYVEPSAENESYDPTIHCNYCGKMLSNKKEYCSDACEQKDSVWHKGDSI